MPDFNRFDRLIGWDWTKRDYKNLAAHNGGEFLPCWHDVAMMFDVVGSTACQRIMEDARLAGVRFRYFNNHQERLAEFQQRLDAMKQRRTCGAIFY